MVDHSGSIIVDSFRCSKLQQGGHRMSQVQLFLTDCVQQGMRKLELWRILFGALPMLILLLLQHCLSIQHVFIGRSFLHSLQRSFWGLAHLCAKLLAFGEQQPFEPVYFVATL